MAREIERKKWRDRQTEIDRHTYRPTDRQKCRRTR